MAFRINRVRAVAADDAGFSKLASALPDGAERCLYCRRRSPDSLAMILVADESDDDPRALPGFKWSLQRLPEPIVATRQAPRRGFSRPGSCAVWR